MTPRSFRRDFGQAITSRFVAIGMVIVGVAAAGMSGHPVDVLVGFAPAILALIRMAYRAVVNREHSAIMLPYRPSPAPWETVTSTIVVLAAIVCMWAIAVHPTKPLLVGDVIRKDSETAGINWSGPPPPLLHANVGFTNISDDGMVTTCKASQLVAAAMGTAAVNATIASVKARATRENCKAMEAHRNDPAWISIYDTVPLTAWDISALANGRITFVFSAAITLKNRVGTWTLPICGLSYGDPRIIADC